MIGDIISAGAKLIGGLIGSSDAKAAREAQERQLARNEALQREFAQSSIQWRVEDAKKAGISPIFALGGSGASFTPSNAVFSAGSPMASAVSSMGQDIGRSVYATASNTARQEAFQETMAELSVRRATLQNDLLASQIARLRDQRNPPLPTDGTNISLPDEKMKGVTPLVIGGSKIQQDRGISDAQEFENRYGEMAADLIFGPYIMWRDFNTHVLEPRSKSFEERRKRWHGEK